MKSKLLRKIMKTKGNKKKSLVEEAIISFLKEQELNLQVKEQSNQKEQVLIKVMINKERYLV